MPSSNKFERCVQEVKKNSPDVNPWAVCTESVGADSAAYKEWRRKRRKKKSAEEKDISQKLETFVDHITAGIALLDEISIDADVDLGAEMRDLNEIIVRAEKVLGIGDPSS